ncbi:hypothetical protein [Streptomyces natalensis]|uniref:Uncharacterized protein n=1 Tax=Streptomyces natalensis ATCC 27448 TaxID=1240678 RepID=A0A0D7CKF9_9ACTN|nr:hypothetical protein [Streptomyces natalensis]KIZ15927.1 hypothetical protein SNA_21925 [Streptomyces natalensis ATCC 27448]
MAIGNDLTDTDGHARSAYAATPGELVLVRPDGHIGIRTPRRRSRTAPKPDIAPEVRGRTG